MSKRHQVSRRRAYGRRQHDLHQRPEFRAVELYPAAVDQPSASDAGRPLPGPLPERRLAGFLAGLTD